MIIGVRGSGKTYFMKALIQKHLDAGRRVILYDTEHEFSDFKHPKLTVYSPKAPASKAEFEQVCKWVWSHRRVVFAVESVEFFAVPSRDLEVDIPSFKQIVHWGREKEGQIQKEKKRIGLIMTARRIASVHKDPCSQAIHWFVFSTHLPNDTKYLRQFVGKVADQARKLPRYHFVYWTSGQEEGEICRPIGEI